MRVREDENEESYFDFVGSRMRNQDRVAWDRDVVRFLLSLQANAQIGDIPIYTEHQRKGAIFHGHPNYRQNGQWNDWALVDWGAAWGRLPCEIWCFIDLTFLEGGHVELEEQRVGSGIYAVVESS